MRIDLLVHIAAGTTGIIAGYVALSAAKGGRLHRKSGTVFVYAMIIMALVGASMAAYRNAAPAANVPMGLLTAYLVVTALTTVRPPATRGRWLDVALMSVPSMVCVALLSFGIAAVSAPRGRIQGMPAAPFFIFAVVALIASVGDLRLVRSGGVRAIAGVPRLVRHLWRMTLALVIAAFSFFLGQAKVIPKPIRIMPLLIIPPLVALAALLYWLWRIRFRRSLRGIVVVASRDLTPTTVR